jgi:hypothetical protein
MTNNKQQTAVEWLIEKHFGGIENCTPDFRHKIEQAKEMEKEQIENAYQAGQDNVDYTASFVDEDGLETYYKKTYGGGEQ